VAETEALLEEELLDPGVIKEPPEIPPEGTLAFALFAFDLNVSRVLPELGLSGCLSRLQWCDWIRSDTY